MDAAQREMLMAVVNAYVSLMTPDVAALRTANLRKAGVEKIAFAWAGGPERGRKHYYRVQGPTFLIEFDNTQNDGNHVHSVWRDFAGDFGRDLLREHLRTITSDSGELATWLAGHLISRLGSRVSKTTTRHLRIANYCLVSASVFVQPRRERGRHRRG